MINWKISDIRRIRIELDSPSNGIAEKLSCELGVSKQDVIRKIKEIKEEKRIRKMI